MTNYYDRMIGEIIQNKLLLNLNMTTKSLSSNEKNNIIFMKNNVTKHDYISKKRALEEIIPLKQQLLKGRDLL